MPAKKIKVLVVDDSAVIRSILSKSLAEDPALEVVGTASDSVTAQNRLIALSPDVMTLDVDMPKEDGLSFLQRVMAERPVRTLVISDLAASRPDVRAKAMAAGAADVMPKPSALKVYHGGVPPASEVSSRIRAIAAQPMPSPRFAPGSAAARQIEASGRAPRLLAIASSTGGPEALKEMLPKLPKDIPATLIVQHIRAEFTRALAASLQQSCPFEVREARDGDRVQSGVALIAPGDFHMEIIRSGPSVYVKLNQRPLLHGVRPAADVLFHSVARAAAAAAIGVVLTGMGRDGAEGLMAMRRAGSYNIAQDESSCTVFGMPKEAIRAGAIHSVLPLAEIPGGILHACRKTNAA